MAYIKWDKNSLGFELNNIKFLHVHDMFEFYQGLINNKYQLASNNNFMSDKNYIITPTTKVKDIFSLMKTNIMGKNILQYFINNFQENALDTFIPEDFKNNICNYVTNFIDININNEIDVLKLINVFFEYTSDSLLNKKNILGLIKLLSNNNEYDSKILLFASDWLDSDIINKLIESNIKTVIVFNQPHQELIKIINDNKQDLILQKKNTFEFFDFDKDNDDEWKKNKEVKFIKI